MTNLLTIHLLWAGIAAILATWVWLSESERRRLTSVIAAMKFGLTIDDDWDDDDDDDDYPPYGPHGDDGCTLRYSAGEMN